MLDRQTLALGSAELPQSSQEPKDERVATCLGFRERSEITDPADLGRRLCEDHTRHGGDHCGSTGEEGAAVRHAARHPTPEDPAEQ